MANVNSKDPNTGVDIIRNRYHDNTKVVDGARYTTKENPNKLTNNDFLELMLTEMKMQDPTKPMDSQRLMDSQLKMSTIEANLEMSKSMKSLQESYANSALSTAANLIGKIIEDGSKNDKGIAKSYKVETVENKNGELYVKAREIIGLRDILYNKDTKKLTLYDKDGYIIEDGKKTEYKIVLKDGRFDRNKDGSLKLVDKDNNKITDEAVLKRYLFHSSNAIYAKESTSLPVKKILEVR